MFLNTHRLGMCVPTDGLSEGDCSTKYSHTNFSSCSHYKKNSHFRAMDIIVKNSCLLFEVSEVQSQFLIEKDPEVFDQTIPVNFQKFLIQYFQ